MFSCSNNKLIERIEDEALLEVWKALQGNIAYWTNVYFVEKLKLKHFEWTTIQIKHLFR